MATALASQLLAVAASDNERPLRKNTRPSILFDARQAADIDTATIFSLALSGLEELVTENSRFMSFKRTLFSVESCQTDRELQGQEFNSKLNASIHTYMCLVADFLLLSPAHQTLEYLIRRYKIHIYNVDDLIRFTLPYHETSLFVRVVQLSNIEKTRWHFLEGVKKSGAAPPRELLVQQCLRDMAVLEGICEAGHSSLIGAKISRSKTTYSFSATIVLEVLAAIQAVDSTLVNRILPYIVQSFEKGSSEESEVGGLMIIGTLANKTKLSEDTITLFFDLITKVLNNEVWQVEGGKLLQMAVMIMVQIMQTQSLSTFPEKAFRLTVKVRELPDILSRISTTFNAEKALLLLIKGLVRHCLVSPHYGQLLQELVSAVPLRGHAESVVLDLLELSAESIESQDTMDEGFTACEIKKLLLAIKNIFPEELDKATNRFLESLTRATSSTKDGVLSFLNSSFEGSLHTVLPESNQSIYRSLEHPEAHVRGLALKHVAAVSKSNPKMKIVCSEALLLGLHDSDLSVVRSVLSVDGLEMLIDSSELLMSEASVLARCVGLLEKGSRSMKAEANSVGRHCLEFLSSAFLEANPSYAERVGHIFLSNMLLFPKTWKLNLAALKLAKNVKWSLFKGLATVKEESLKPDDRNDKESKKLWLHDINTKVIESLANGLREDSDSLSLQFTACATNYERAKPLFVLALLQSLTRAREGLTWELVNKYLGFLKQEWIALESSEEFSTFKISNDDVLKENIFSFEFFKTLQREPKIAFTSLLLSCFYKVLLSLPALDRSSKKEYENAMLSVMEDLFVVFSAPHSKLIFHEHLKLLLRKVPTSPLVFLSKFFNSEGGTVPVNVQMHSLSVLLAYWSDTNIIQKSDMQTAVPHFLVALASPVKAIRRAACKCLSKLHELWRESAGLPFVPNGSEIQKHLLDSDTFEKFLEFLLEFEGSFVSNGDFVSTFLTSSLGSFNGYKKIDAEKEATMRLKKSAQISTFLFLLRNALSLPMYAQYTLVVALKGAGRMQDQALETKRTLESLLSRWMDWKLDGSNEKGLSKLEVQLFRHFLQVHLHYEGMFSVVQGNLNGKSIWFQTLMTVLSIDQAGAHIDSDALETFCIVLGCLEDRTFNNLDINSKDAIFKKLIQLSIFKPEAVQLAARTSLQKFCIHPSVVVRYIDGLLDRLLASEGERMLLEEDVIDVIKSLTALLEFLMSKDDISDMHELIPSLFGSLRKLTKIDAVRDEHGADTINLERTKEAESLHVSYVQQLVLEVIEKIAKCTQGGVARDTMDKQYDVDFLVEFIHGTTDVATLNQSLGLLTTLGRVSPNLVLKHVITVFSVLGETTLIQDNSHSYLVTEKLISAVVPSWLKKMKNPRLLLQIFVKALPQIPTHRRTPLLKTTLRLMQESTSLHILLLLLFESSLLSSRRANKSLQKRMRNSKRKSVDDSDVQKWSEAFSTSIFEEYGLSICLPALLNLLKATQEELLSAEKQGEFDKVERAESAWELEDKVFQFISTQLQKVGHSVELQNKENEAVVRDTLVNMLEEVLSVLQRISSDSLNKKMLIGNDKRSLQERAGHLLECITNLMSPTSFAEGVIHLLRSSNKNMKIRALRLITAKMKSSEHQYETLKGKKKVNSESKDEEAFSKDTLSAYERLVESIGVLLAQWHEADSLDMILVAVSALHSCSQRLAKSIPSVFVSNLHILIENAQQSTTSAPASLQCIASIVSETGPNSLPVLNELIIGVMATAKQHSSFSQRTEAMKRTVSTESTKEADVQLAVLSVLEAVVQRLGSFLSPYLDEILNLLVLEPCFLSSTNKNLNKKSESVRHLLPKMIPVRLLLDPLISAYDRALQRGETSMLASIEMLDLVVTSFDKPSVLAHYKRVFELCLGAFDLRRRPPNPLTSVTVVETSIISLFTGLVLKLSENTFKPLFVRILEWAESELPDDGVDGNKKNIFRNIVFYRVVNQLADKLRSVFVPYFQYMLKGCVQHLIDGQDRETVKPRKKSKVSAEIMQRKQKWVGLTSAEWHLRHLIISALHKCFLYDNVSFLDAQKFQMLLGPLVEQITVEKPSLEKSASNTLEWIPSSQDMDDVLVACLGQMAITAGTDLLWKPLNHEVLLCTRSEVVRVRIVSLDIVKFLVENLKEDYLALLPETIPFLAELLEDHELTIVSKSQDIIKLLEDLSGESLSQYL